MRLDESHIAEGLDKEGGGVGWDGGWGIYFPEGFCFKLYPLVWLPLQSGPRRRQGWGQTELLSGSASWDLSGL